MNFFEKVIIFVCALCASALASATFFPYTTMADKTFIIVHADSPDVARLSQLLNFHEKIACESGKTADSLDQIHALFQVPYKKANASVVGFASPVRSLFKSAARLCADFGTRMIVVRHASEFRQIAALAFRRHFSLELGRKRENSSFAFGTKKQWKVKRTARKIRDQRLRQAKFDDALLIEHFANRSFAVSGDTFVELKSEVRLHNRLLNWFEATIEPECLLSMTFEAMRRDLRATLRRVAAHLGVEPAFGGAQQRALLPPFLPPHKQIENLSVLFAQPQ